MLSIQEEYGDDSPPEKKPRLLLCEVCNKEESKYKCPRCFYRTCSVKCSKKHKEDFQVNLLCFNTLNVFEIKLSSSGLMLW